MPANNLYMYVARNRSPLPVLISGALAEPFGGLLLRLGFELLLEDPESRLAMGFRQFLMACCSTPQAQASQKRYLGSISNFSSARSHWK